ncbi:MAG: PucR family transcriptional regulator, partial [Solirubrobacteraceae bacterium]
GHAIQWQAWSEAVEARRLAADARRALLQAGSEYMFTYADRCARWVEIEYTRQRDGRLRSQEQLRVQHVRDLLDGTSRDNSQLGYELTGWHIALVASGHEADSVLQDIGRRLDAQLLSIVADVLTWWAWLRTDNLKSGQIERVIRSLSPPPGVSLAIGEPGEGPQGFQQSHAQAAHAAAVGARLGTPTTRYNDIALEALALADLDRARAFVTRELGPLASDDRRAQTLRNTLRAYFAAGQTGSSTAVILGVHERTVGNRLRAAEALIDHSILGRRAELETALRIHALLQKDEPQTAAGSPPPTHVP